MVDFSKLGSRTKSEQEKQFDELNDAYEKQFGQPYVFAIGADAPTWDEAIADIRRRMTENNPQPSPDYQPGNIY